LLARFPTVRQAVAFVEFYELVPTLAEMVRQGDLSEVIVDALADAIAEELADRNPPNAAQLRLGREQLGRPEFRTYLAGRLGLVSLPPPTDPRRPPVRPAGGSLLTRQRARQEPPGAPVSRRCGRGGRG
jgi:hypothetical protein